MSSNWSKWRNIAFKKNCSKELKAAKNGKEGKHEWQEKQEKQKKG